MRRKAFAQAIVIVLMTCVFLEIALSLFDPLGLHFLQSLDFMQAFYTGDITQYRLAPGEYQMKGWQATIDADQMRTVPDSGEGCRIVFFGDSMTWGWGVNDDQTFVNLLAREWKDVQLVNAGVVGYNSAQVRMAIERIPFDVGVYLLVDNDANLFLTLGGNNPTDGPRIYRGIGLINGSPLALALYERYLLFRLFPPPPDPVDMPRFYADMDAILARGDVHIFAFEEPFGQSAAEQYAVTLLPMYTGVNSPADRHPNAAGHQQIAQSLLDYRDTIQSQAC